MVSRRKLKKMLHKLLGKVLRLFPPTDFDRVGIAVYNPDSEKYVVFFEDGVEVVEPDNVAGIPYHLLARDSRMLYDAVFGNLMRDEEEHGRAGRVAEATDYDYSSDPFYPHGETVAEFKPPCYWIEGYERVKKFAPPDAEDAYHYYYYGWWNYEL